MNRKFGNRQNGPGIWSGFLNEIAARNTLRLTGAVLLLIVMAAAPPSARGESEFRLDLTFGGRWHDAEKSSENRNDDWLCWASTAANILSWTRWGDMPNLSNEDEIFTYYTQHWTDDPSGSPREAWRWWFNGENHAPSGARLVATGGNFWPEVPFPSAKWECLPNAVFCGIGQNMLKRDPYILRKMLERGYGLALQIVKPEPDGGRDSHMITLWGFTFDEKNRFKGILITDSDDAKDFKDAKEAEDRLAYYPVKLTDSIWWFTYRDQQWRILAAYGLLARHIYTR
jgi:hypothetical protein